MTNSFSFIKFIITKSNKYYICNYQCYADGFTPLMALCNSTLKSEDYQKCLILLLEAKADANRTTRRR